jgi:Mrp family chromosome partitioning ATPase
MNERGLVDVPENAIRDEPIAFGLTAVQLGICAVAVLVAAILNLLPLWDPIRLVLVLGGAGPIGIAAALPVRGEPAYRWIGRAVRHRRGGRAWRATLLIVDKSQLSGPEDTALSSVDPGDRESAQLRGRHGHDHDGSNQVHERATDQVERDEASVAPHVRGRAPMENAAPRLTVLPRSKPESADADKAAPDREELARPPAIPHVLTFLRVVVVLSFVGGVGKTTLAVEIATLIGGRARYRTIEGDERPVRVLLLDASRMSPACGLRLGLSGERLSRSKAPRVWTEAGALEAAIERTDWRVDLVTLAHRPYPDAGAATSFGPSDAQAILDQAHLAGYQVLVVDLGALHEKGHRHLIDQAQVVLGIVRPTIESLPDVPRMTEYVRALAAGRKLVVVPNMADDDRAIRNVLGPDRVPIVGPIARSDIVVTAGERGEPAWRTDPAFERSLLPVATMVWPLLEGDSREPVAPSRRLGSAVRRAIAAVGGGRG